MGTENLILLLIEAGFYFVFMVGILHLRHQLGIGVFVAALGVMHFLETYLAAVFYVELPFGVISPGSSVLFSGKLMMILLLYVKEDAAVVRAREIVHAGRLGRPVAFSLERASGLGSRTSWRQDFSQSGVIFDVGVHLLDLIQWVSGQRFVEVSAYTHPDRRQRVPDDTVTVLGRLDKDCHAVARATREIASAENTLIIEGTEATLITSALRFATEHVVGVRDRAGTTEARFPASPAYELEVLAFEGELRGVRSLLPDGEESLQTVAVTQAVLQAIEERRSVAVPAVE